MRYTLISLMLGSLLVVGGCSDSSTTLDTVEFFETPQPPPSIRVISGSFVDQGGDVIQDVEVEFYEDGVASTNILSIDGQDLPSLTVANGSFQITTKNDITSFKMIVSADGYLTKDVDVSFDANAETYTTQIELHARDAKGVVNKIEKKLFTIPITTTDAAITITAEKPVSDGDTSKGSAEISIPALVELQDAEGKPILVSELNVEVTYVESQEADDAASEEGVVSIASIIPKGLNDVASDDAVSETVLVPLGVAQVNITNEDDTEIKKFDKLITITINLPANTFIPSLGRTVQEGDQFTVRSYDEETQVWSTEPNKAIVGEENDDGSSFPANLLVDHLTLFALTDPVAVCQSPISFDFSGDDIPATGLQLSVKSNDINIVETITTGSSSFVISADKAKSMGIAANAEASIAVKSFGGKPWYPSGGEVALCGESISVVLANPVVTVDEDLDIVQECSNDETVFSAIENAIVLYQLDSNSVQFRADETSAGSYALVDLDVAEASYTVTVNTRTVVPNQTLTITPDGTDENLVISVECSVITGTGTGAG